MVDKVELGSAFNRVSTSELKPMLLYGQMHTIGFGLCRGLVSHLNSTPFRVKDAHIITLGLTDNN